MDELEHTIVIVGAGPTGLALGAELKRLGISSLILDRLEAGANTSRAAVVHARTLEVLEPLGVPSASLDRFPSHNTPSQKNSPNWTTGDNH